MNGLPMLEAIRWLRTEVNCRIEHGAESGGHLDYVQKALDAIIADAEEGDACPDCGGRDESL